jgi:hypothetical protein
MEKQTERMPSSHDSGWVLAGSHLLNIETKALQIKGVCA